MKPCPFCQKEVQDDAHKCRFCGAWFTNDAEEKQKLKDREEQARKLLSPQKDKTGEDLGETTVCFSVSTRKMVVLSLVTCGIYETYWFFRNWLAIRRQENKKISPVGRTIFSVFYCYTLFKRIINAAVSRGYQGKEKPGSLTVAYILLVMVAANAPSPFDLIGILSFVPLLFVNNIIRFNNLEVDPAYQEERPLTGGEIAYIAVGLLIWGLNILAIFFPEG